MSVEETSLLSQFRQTLHGVHAVSMPPMADSRNQVSLQWTAPS